LGELVVGVSAVSKRRIKVEQRPTLSGVILEKDTKEKLVGAHIYLFDKKRLFVSGVYSDQKGKFEIDLSKISNPSNYELEISYIGYETQSFPISDLKINRKQKIQLTKGVNLPEVIVSSSSDSDYLSVRMGGFGSTVCNSESIKEESKQISNKEKNQSHLKNKDNFLCFPNPFIHTTNLRFNWSKSEYMFLRLMSMDGSVLFENRILTLAGKNEFQINTEDLGIAGGMYILLLESIEGIVVSKPLIKVDY